MTIDFLAFSEELCKLGARSYLKDFAAGVDPTGTRTFHYGMEDARAGKSSRLREATGTLGGAVGGATIVPAVVSGIIEGAKGARSGGWRGAAMGAAKGTYKPFQQIIRAARGARTLGKIRAGGSATQGEISNLRTLVSDAGFTLPQADKHLREATEFPRLRGMVERARGQARRVGEWAADKPRLQAAKDVAVERVARTPTGKRALEQGKAVRGELRELVDIITKAKKSPEGATGAALEALAKSTSGRKALGQGQEFLKSRAIDFGAAIGLSAALAAGSANLQYRKGGEVGSSLRRNK